MLQPQSIGPDYAACVMMADGLRVVVRLGGMSNDMFVCAVVAALVLRRHGPL